MQNNKQEISVIGAGAWGTAIANALAENNEKVVIQARETEVVESINKRNENEVFLKGIKLNKRIVATSSFKDVDSSKFLFFVTPAQFLGATIEQMKKEITFDGKVLIICSKGIDTKRIKLLSEIVEESCGNEYFILSGPSFAHEVAEKEVTKVSIAGKNKVLAQEIIDVMQSSYFKLKYNKDAIGTEICGAIKNVVAIACGISKGMGARENTKAAIITKGMSEIAGLIKAYGGKEKTITEPCGIGDMILTCNSESSRNFSFGVELAKHIHSEAKPQVVEGVATADALSRLCATRKLDMPLCLMVDAICKGEKKPEDILFVINNYN